MKSTILSTACLFVTSTAALNPIAVKQQQFVDSKTNERFVIIGVDYDDPLSNPDTCLRDAALMQQLGINAIRSYSVDPTQNHDQCASIFNMAGIYMLIDVNSPQQSIDRSNPGPSYTTSYLSHIFQVVEAFKNYDNTLGFFAGNEIINDVATGGPNPPYIRAVQRDLKSYIANHASRSIPVGYSAAQVQEVLQDSWAYLQCNNAANTGSPDLSRSDFFGLNSYSWCGSGSSYTISGYSGLEILFSNSTIPVFFSEYGCNVPLPRVFDEVPSLYGPNMTALSGGLVYEWYQQANDYGLIDITSSNGTLALLPDYSVLASKYATLDWTTLTSSPATPNSLTPPPCSPNLISADGFSTDFAIPAAPAGAAELIANGVPSANTGAIVAVTKTVVDIPVFATNGASVLGLSITSMAEGGNRPGTLKTAAVAVASSSSSSSIVTTTTSSSVGTSSVAKSSSVTVTAAQPSPTKNAARRMAVGGMVGAVAVGVGALVVGV